MKVDLDAYLCETGVAGATSAERLRQLAIHLESEASFLTGMGGWEALKRIYFRARRLEPKNAEVLISMSISASFFAEVSVGPSHHKKRLWKLAEGYAREAIDLAPRDSCAHYALGTALYFVDRTEEALESFDQALDAASDSDTVAWARLYRAHCLHDSKKYDAALDAYDGVDRSVFMGVRAWRSDVLTEQRAHCLHMSGRRKEAFCLLEKILERYEKEPVVAYNAMSTAFWQLVEDLPNPVVERAKQIERRASEKGMESLQRLVSQVTEREAGPLSPEY